MSQQLSLARFRESIHSIDNYLDAESKHYSVNQAREELSALLDSLPTDTHVCHFCWAPFEEYADLLRHHDTCQSIQRNRVKIPHN